MSNMELPYERDAMRDESLPRGLSLTDSKMYLALRWLYQQYRDGHITREKASTEKKRLILAYKEEKRIDEMNRAIAQLWQRIETPARTYTFEPTRENADKFFAAVYGLSEHWRSERVPVKDVVFDPYSYKEGEKHNGNESENKEKEKCDEIKS